jgi:hypothetical protein
MRLDLLQGTFGIARLDGAHAVPDWASGGELLSITRTPDELSIVCDAAKIPQSVRCRGGWRCLKVEGPLDFSLSGVLAALAEPLARAGIPIFVVSTFDTDDLLAAGADLDRAVAELAKARHETRHVRK